MWAGGAHMHHGARVCILTLCIYVCVYTPPWKDISFIHLHNKLQMPRLKVEVRVQVGLLLSVLLISARFCSPFWSSGFQKQTSHVVCLFMQVFAVLPRAIALTQNSKTNPQTGSWHHNNSPYFHRVVVAAFLGFSFFQSAFLPFWCFVYPSVSFLKILSLFSPILHN